MINSNGPVALIMAGGTGGHIFPAQAVAKLLHAQGWTIHWLGTADRMEAKMVPEFGWHFHPIEVAGLRGKSLKALLNAPVMLWRSIAQARAVLNQVQPQLVLGFGGYASGPGGFAAWMKGVPLLIHEQNAVAGTTNKLLAKLANQVMVAFPTAFSNLSQRQVLGNPVRSELIGVKTEINFSKGLNILIVGGSLGAKALNDILPTQLKQVAASGPVQVRHQTGQAMFTQVQQNYADAPASLQVEVTAFIENMADSYRWADLVICRAGALTVSEVACAGVAAIFVPLPSAIDDHQTANANWLVQQGAAMLWPQTDLNNENLVSLLQSWLSDKTPLAHMAQRARSCAIDDAAEQVVAVCRHAIGLK